MLKKISIRKIIVSLSALFALFLIYFIPSGNDDTLEVDYELNYIDESAEKSVIYLLDSYNMLGRTEIVVSSNREVENRATQLLNILIKGESNEDTIPNGFKAVLPSETKVLSKKYEEGLIKVNFSKDLIDDIAIASKRSKLSHKEINGDCTAIATCRESNLVFNLAKTYP